MVNKNKTLNQEPRRDYSLGRANIYDMFRFLFGCIAIVCVTLVIGVSYVSVNMPTDYQMTLNINADDNFRESFETIERISDTQFTDLDKALVEPRKIPSRVLIR